MKYMKAAEFKAKCLKVMDELAAGGEEEVVVTKRGKVVARVLPPLPEASVPYVGWGACADLYIPYDADLITPLVDPDEWTGDEHNLDPENGPAPAHGESEPRG